MKSLFLVLIMILPSIVFAQNNQKTKELQQNIQKAMEKEKKFAIEQKFYTKDEYDFNGAKIDKNTLKYIKPIEPDPLMETDDFQDMPN